MDAKTLKSLIKSAEATIVSETAMLDQYLSTKGVNPKYAPKNLKVAHSKTNAFKKWSRVRLNRAAAPKPRAMVIR